ncbi:MULTISPECIES: ABC transporter permease [Ruminococcus]|uniref:ABC-type transport system involved in multi-copper enzyme maturation, permease component n=1 Tax=Ruminococcus albus (strain ATCC 27210 / DSM 20455 / JCM 14654 / NCDO 2250 / 7) TaxID=697329 RepID=E6UFU0_RUMA7|nr:MULTISPECIES: ABC transporter permease subunit [Ruminococcus]ADU23079.1 ABC-type transport system involved in multi-copper enzyme maturation, permease component [Ruminococcus albus 7 = DSM 20455]MCR5020882.1 ABC transporter permease [Ruminococcus sp.]
MFSLYKKEIQSFFYSPFAYVLSALFMLIFGIFFVIGIANMKTSVYQFSFPDMFYNYFFYFMFIIPLLTMRSFADERRGGTEVQLLTSPLTITQIVLAKFFSIVTVFAFMLVLSLFFPIYVSFHGTVIWSSLICSYASFFLWGLVCIAIGMLLSSMQSNAIIAAIIGEIVMEGFLALDQLAATKWIESNPKMNSVITWFSMQRRFLFFAQGLFRLEDLIFFLSLTVMVLFWIILHIENRRRSHN